MSSAPSDTSESSLAARGRSWRRQAWTCSIVIFIVAASLRLLHHHDAMASPLCHERLPMYDSRYYDKCARQIAGGDLWGDEVFFMSPLYPYSLALCYKLLTDNLSSVLLFQSLFGAGSCVLIYLIGRMLFCNTAGLVAGLLAALYPVFFFFDAHLLHYSQTMFVHLAALVLLLVTARRHDVRAIPPWQAARDWALCGLALGVCAAAHGTALILFPGVLLWRWLSDEAVWAKLRACATFSAGFAVVVGAITARNYFVAKDFVLITSNAGMNLYMGNNAEATGTNFPTTFPFKGAKLSDYYDGWQRGPDEPSPSEVSRRTAAWALAFMREHPWQEAKLLARKFRLLFNDLEIPINDHYYFFQQYSRVLRWPLPSFGIVAALGLTGALVAVPRWRSLFLLYLLLGSQVFAYTLNFVLSRYRLILVASLMIFAGALLVHWTTWIRQRRLRPLLASLALSCGILAWSLTPVPGFDRSYGLGLQYADLGGVYLERGDHAEAERALKAAIDSSFSPHRGDDAERKRMDCRTSLAEVYARTERWAEAAVQYKLALDMIDRTNPAPSQREALLRAWTDARRRAAGHR